MRTLTVTCATPGCGNAGHAIPLLVDDDVEGAVCGVCGQAIDDVVETPAP